MKWWYPLIVTSFFFGRKISKTIDGKVCRHREKWKSKPGMVSRHVSAEMNVDLGGYKRQANYHLWNLESICKMAQLHPRCINRSLRDGYKTLGFYPSYGAMLRSGWSENHCAIIWVFPLRVFMRCETQWDGDTSHPENLLGRFLSLALWQLSSGLRAERNPVDHQHCH